MGEITQETTMTRPSPVKSSPKGKEGKIKMHNSDCQCEECRVFYGWWIKKGYNKLPKEYHDIALSSFRLAVKVFSKQVIKGA